MQITFRNRLYRASRVVLPGTMVGFGAGRAAVQQGIVEGVAMRVAGQTTDKAFGQIGRKMTTGAMWRRVRKPSAALIAAFLAAQQEA